jgi:membrane protease YdiL (CAAX protease family)
MRPIHWLRLPGAVLLAVLVFVVAGSVSQGIGKAIPDAWPDKTWTTTSIFQILMAALAVGIMLIAGHGRLAAFGFRRGSHFPWRPVALSVFIVEGIIFLAFLPFPQKGPGHFAGDFSFLQTVVGVWLIASTCEEVLSRGLVMGLLEPLAGKGVRVFRVVLSVPVITAALLFSAMHVPLLVMGIDRVSGIQILFATAALGIIAGYYRERSGSLIPAILAHMLANIFGMGFEAAAGLFR